MGLKSNNTGARRAQVFDDDMLAVEACDKLHSAMLANNTASAVYLLFFDEYFTAPPTNNNALVAWIRAEAGAAVPSYLDFGSSGYPLNRTGGFTILLTSALNVDPSSVLVELGLPDSSMAAVTYS